MENNNLIIENKKPVEIIQEIEEVIERQEFADKIENQKVIKALININNFWHSTNYIGSPDSNIWTELDQNIVSNRHITTSPFNNFCLGCLCSNGDSRTFQFSSGGKLVLETPESGMQVIHIPPQGGVVKFEVRGNRVILSLRDEKVEQVNSNETILFDEENKRMIRKSEKGKAINLTEEI